MKKQMKPGYIILYKDGKGPLADKIREDTGSIYNHGGLYFDTDGFIVEALPSGVEITNEIDPMTYDGVDIYEVIGVDYNSNVLKKLVFDVHKIGYDYLALVKQWLLKHWNYRMKIQTTRWLMCFETIVRLNRRYGVDLFPGRDAETINGKDFENCPYIRRIK